MVTALARTMEKIHHDRGIAIEVHADEAARFRGERQDLEEMIGNLVDNACKWASSRVAIEVACERPDPAGAARVRIVVDDDGRGLSPAEREQVAHARPPARRDQAGLGARPVDRDRACRALWRRADARHGAARRLARRAGVAGGLTPPDFCRNCCVTLGSNPVSESRNVRIETVNRRRLGACAGGLRRQPAIRRTRAEGELRHAARRRSAGR